MNHIIRKSIFLTLAFTQPAWSGKSNTQFKDPLHIEEEETPVKQVTKFVKVEVPVVEKDAKGKSISNEQIEFLTTEVTQDMWRTIAIRAVRTFPKEFKKTDEKNPKGQNVICQVWRRKIFCVNESRKIAKSN